MTEQLMQEPWLPLEQLVEARDGEALGKFVEELSPGEARRAIDHLTSEMRLQVLDLLSPEQAAALVDHIPESQAAELIERLPPESAAAIIQEMPSNELADLLNDLDEEDAEAILLNMEPDEAEEARVLSRYPDDVAGGLMITEFVSFYTSATVRTVLDDLRANADEYRDYDVQYVYITEDDGTLVGVLRMRDIILARPDEDVGNLMIKSPLFVEDNAPLDELRNVFDRISFYGVPVLDASGRLVGIVRRAGVEEALAERSQNAYRRSQGILGGDELRTMPLGVRSGRRLAWLSINVVLNIIAASVIGFYQDTLSTVIALAVFLPIISDMSGCSGNQAVAVSMREMTLGVIRHNEVFRVWMKELAVGLINGLALGLLLGFAAWVWKGNVYLGLVVGFALACNTLVAVSIGGAVPLVLKGMKLDPALASGPILTTVTDMCGFFILLSTASAFIHHLQL